ncbi:MAG TPA: DNA double-strand break repair nuclease NurA, partial [Candidatus Aenigmarchaeota archaeon]|nr:DNA double-strand break repair nuclease NurA [Candidatus Aenigmarchaeota archaeon]
MEEIFSKLDEISQQIKNLEEERKRLAEFLREIKEFELEKDSRAVEDKLSVKVGKVELDNLRFVGVDGGLAKRSYHSLDLILVRAVGVIFDYRKGKLDSVSYFPSVSPTPKLRIVHDASENDFQYIASFERINAEINVLKACLEKNPSILLADGSIAPHPSDQPKKGTAVYEEYKKLLDNYKSLYRSSAGALLAGVVEDSRSSTFSEYISDKILSQIKSKRVEELKRILRKTRDTNLLYHVLNKGERSFVMRMNPNADLGDYGKNLYLFYLKTTEFDRPVRVEFYASGDPIRVADRIAALLFSVSSENQEYGLPPVIIEADGRAKISEGELDII